MDRNLTARIFISAVLFVTVCVVSSGCRSSAYRGGLMRVSGLSEPVPSQWEPPVETLDPSAFEESSPAE